MDRLTSWNGTKWVLPQGRTATGESNWRLIAERLAAYENTGMTPEEILEMKARDSATENSRSTVHPIRRI